MKILPLSLSAYIIGVVKQNEEAGRDSRTCYSFSWRVLRKRKIVCSYIL